MKPTRHAFTTNEEWEAIKKYPVTYSVLILTLAQRQSAQRILTVEKESK